MSTLYTITAARREDLPLLPLIERAAARLLIGHAPESVLGDTTGQDELEYAQSQGLVWVALANNVPVGFAHVEVVEPSSAHLKEIDVHPQHGQRGLGTRLVLAVCAWAAMAGYQTVTLTTFRDVAWNMPFYARLGFREIPADKLSEVLLSILRDETRRGLDPARRVAMERLCLLPVGATHL
jgi:GNAT superfamily N-acetyltransferase